MDDERAFDAVESYLCETSSEPSSDWRTVSLVTALRGLITRGPEFKRPTPEARRAAIKATASELTRRGLDATALVRYGMSREVAAPIIAALLIRLIFGEESAVDSVDVEGVDVEGVDVEAWRTALEIDRPQPRPRIPTAGELTVLFDEIIGPAIPRILQWVANSSLDDIIELSATPTSAPIFSTTGPSERLLRQQYRWAVDHFATTYFPDWEIESLQYELRWLDGDILPPCPEEMMQDRSVSRRDLVEEIARRAVYETGHSDVGESVVAEMTRHAQDLLRRGRFLEAAAVFEFGAQYRPEDPEMRNNLGFCLVPVDPNRALENLKLAVDMGYHANAINTHNQMCCYVALGRPRAALNLADSEWGRMAHGSQPATLWNPSHNGGWELVKSDDSYGSIATLAAEIARREGWLEQTELWTANQQRRAESCEE